MFLFCCNFRDDVMLPMKRRGLSESSSSSSDDSSDRDLQDDASVSATCLVHCLVSSLSYLLFIEYMTWLCLA